MLAAWPSEITRKIQQTKLKRKLRLYYFFTFFTQQLQIVSELLERRDVIIKTSITLDSLAPQTKSSG
jgi:hypothetical protein